MTILFFAMQINLEYLEAGPKNRTNDRTTLTQTFFREMAKNSNFQIQRTSISARHLCLEFNFASNFEPSQNFRTKKVSHLRTLTRDRYCKLNLTRNWMVRILSHLKITCTFHHVTWFMWQISSDDFLSYLKVLPVFNKFFQARFEISRKKMLPRKYF